MSSHHRWTFILLAGLTAARTTRAQEAAARAADSTVECGIAALPHRAVTIDLGTGGFLTVRGWEHDSVRVRARLAGRDWRDTKVYLDRIPEGTRLRSGLGGSPLEKSTSHEFEVWVPRYSDIELHSGGGNVAIVNISAVFKARRAEAPSLSIACMATPISRRAADPFRFRTHVSMVV